MKAASVHPGRSRRSAATGIPTDGARPRRQARTSLTDAGAFHSGHVVPGRAPRPGARHRRALSKYIRSDRGTRSISIEAVPSNGGVLDACRGPP